MACAPVPTCHVPCVPRFETRHAPEDRRSLLIRSTISRAVFTWPSSSICLTLSARTGRVWQMETNRSSWDARR